MNEVYGRHMGDEPPARATFQVAALPVGRPRRDRGLRPRLDDLRADDLLVKVGRHVRCLAHSERDLPEVEWA